MVIIDVIPLLRTTSILLLFWGGTSSTTSQHDLVQEIPNVLKRVQETLEWVNFGGKSNECIDVQMTSIENQEAIEQC